MNCQEPPVKYHRGKLTYPAESRMGEKMRNMIEGYQNKEELTQNLSDAGCSEEMIACLISYLSGGNKEKILSHLEEQRAELLHTIHKEQSGIAYLDELLNCLLKKGK